MAGINIRQTEIISVIIVDTRTGEYWREEGTTTPAIAHFEPREARITLRLPYVDNQITNDASNNKFMDCIHDVATHNRDSKDCAAQLKLDVQDASKPSSTSETSR